MMGFTQNTSTLSEHLAGFALDLERSDCLIPLEAMTDGLSPFPL